MADEGPRPAGWQPTEAFLDAARRFAELRLTQRYRDEEVDYKESLAAVLRRVFSREALEQEGVAARIAAFCRGQLKPADLGLSPSELQLNQKWSYHGGLMNLLGGRYGPIQVGPFHQWAELAPEPEVRDQIREFLYGDVPLAARFDRFSEHLRDAYQSLHAQGQLRSRGVPVVSVQLLATFLGLNEPARYGLYRVGRYSEAATAFGYPLAFTGSRGTRYATATRFLSDLRDALSQAGVPTDSLVEVHNFVWVSTEPAASLGRWELSDFHTFSASNPQDHVRMEGLGAKLERLGKALTAVIKPAAGGAFEHRLLNLDYPPGKTSWKYLTESISEKRFGRAHTKRPQLNVEAGPEGIDVFFAFHLTDHTPESDFVAPRVRQLAGSTAVSAAVASGYGDHSSGERYMTRKRFSPELAIEWPELGIDAIAEELATLLPIYNALTSDEPDQPEVVTVDPDLARIDQALRQTGQVILYGPPGTGKTWAATRFADWWLRQRVRQAVDEGDPKATVPQVTHMTFHPTYSYEDFVEGYRPVPSNNGQLNLKLKPGSFKRVCDAARANSGRDYLVIIDEINRANLPKVFGELITVLEHDKRGREVTLQNGGQFSVPENVLLIGTMNTADRSIRLLDAAFRRRFAFIEFMPNLEPLRGLFVGPLALDMFLEILNARIREKVGREKQVGQSYLLPSGKPIQTEEEFARHFRLEILPLLQEYAYDDFRQLRHFLGDDLVDEERQQMLVDGLSDHELAVRLAAGIARPVEPLPVEA